jgi:hypothetical protein
MDKTCEVFTDMLLYDFLFLAENTEGRNSFDAPRFALGYFNGWPASDEETLVLYDTEALKVQAEREGGANLMRVVAAMITVRESKEGCLGAMQVAYVASSERPEFKGSGKLIYGLASSYFDTPLTSDREHSTSDAGKEGWNKMTSSGQMKLIQPLDNYLDTAQGREYVKVNPDRSFTTSKTPSTSGEFDDCPLATKGEQGLDVSQAVNLTGAFGVYRAAPVSPNALLARHEQFKREMQAAGNDKVDTIVKTAGLALFKKRYFGAGH